MADLKGLKIRVPASKMLEATWRTLGAIPSPLPFPEVFNGLQQGVIDGDALPLASIHQFKFYEPARHISLANVAIGLATFVVSEKFLNKLPQEYQELIIKAAQEFLNKIMQKTDCLLSFILHEFIGLMLLN